MKKLMITLGMFATFCTTEAKVTLPALFTDNMVLQQKSDIILRGHSTNRKEVMVITGWDKHIYMAQTDKQGNWKTEISTPSAGIRISTASEYCCELQLLSVLRSLATGFSGLSLRAAEPA